MAEVKHVNAEEFAALLQENKVVLVDFFADWCGPCKMLAPVVEKLAAAYDGKAAVAKVNVDDEGELAMRFGIQSIPALFIFKDGQVADQLIGLRPYGDIAAALDRAKDSDKLLFIEIECALGSRKDLGRPTTTALENKNNFMQELAKH